jgi:peptidoglycan/LPS O-acetylase OafA/YrhL
VAFHIAKYSFGIYLGHSLLLRWIPMSWAVLPVYLICVAAVSVASFHFVEEPMIRFGQRLTADPVPSGIEERVGK